MSSRVTDIVSIARGNAVGIIIGIWTVAVQESGHVTYALFSIYWWSRWSIGYRVWCTNDIGVPLWWSTNNNLHPVPLHSLKWVVLISCVRIGIVDGSVAILDVVWLTVSRDSFACVQSDWMQYAVEASSECLWSRPLHVPLCYLSWWDSINVAVSAIHYLSLVTNPPDTAYEWYRILQWLAEHIVQSDGHCIRRLSYSPVSYHWNLECRSHGPLSHHLSSTHSSICVGDTA